jgi:hypothetical protein
MLTLIGLAAPATAQGAPEPAFAGLESGDFEEFSQTNALTGTLSLATDRAYEGARSARATYAGGAENGYARGIWNVDWADGDDVWFGGAYYLPVGFHANVQGQVDLLRWDNWSSNPSNTDWGGVSIWGSDKHARLLRFGAGRDSDTLVGPFDLPEGRWFWLEVHQRLSAGGGAVSELYLDGKLVGGSTRPNTYGRGIDRIRYGLVAIAAGAQAKPLEMWFDKATVGTGPAGGTAASVPASAQTSTPAGVPRTAPPSAVQPDPPARAAQTRSCSTDRRAGRRGALRVRVVATTCRTGSRTCRTAYRRAGRHGFTRVRRTRTCRTASQTCRTTRQMVRRKSHGTRRTASRRCRPVA